MTRRQKNRKPKKTERSTQKSFRLYQNQDGELIAWLAEFAKRYKQTDLIRLALYTLSGLDMPPELAELLPPQHAPRQMPLPEPDTSAADQLEALYQELASERAHAAAQFETMLAELAALREDMQRQPVSIESAPAVTDRRRRAHSRAAPAQSTPPDSAEAPETRVSSGIDLSGPPPTTRHRAPAPGKPPTLPEVDEPPFDPEESRRMLIESIHGFGKGNR